MIQIMQARRFTKTDILHDVLGFVNCLIYANVFYRTDPDVKVMFDTAAVLCAISAPTTIVLYFWPLRIEQ